MLLLHVLQVPFIEDVRQVLHVFWLFIPLPVFWALYDQQVLFLFPAIDIALLL